MSLRGLTDIWIQRQVSCPIVILPTLSLLYIYIEFAIEEHTPQRIEWVIFFLLLVNYMDKKAWKYSPG